MSPYQMKITHSVCILLFLLSFKLSGQITGKVTDISTGNPVPFASVFVKGQDIGATTDPDGLFRLKKAGENTLLVISAIGYETQEIFPNEQINIRLHPKVYELPEIRVLPKRLKEKKMINSLKKIRLRSFISPAGDYPWILTRFFAYPDNIGPVSYITQIQILTLCHLDSALFNLRLIAAGSDGQPGADLLKENLVVSAKKGEKHTIIDLPDKIIFPESGLFVAYEWLTVTQNYYQNNQSPGPSIEPMIGILPDEISKEIWMYSRGNWYKSKLFYNPGRTVTGQPAIQLSITY